MKRFINLLLCGLLILGTALSAGGCGGGDEGASSDVLASLPEGTHARGETVEEQGTVTILKQYIEKTGSDAVQPAEGNVYLLLEFRIDNTTDGDMPVSTLLSFTGEVDGQQVKPSTQAVRDRDTHSTLDGTIPAGGGMVGVVGFEVPRDWKLFQVHFYPDAMKSDFISFAVQKK